ncbi:EKC/KEOPS complex subunit GON7 [Larus michahellis]|uniref:EKC/KEOPS complex subunit GON7 n=1 Tax=Larus michahellis TaxID=119627 RepID=UPI003D9BA12C
MELVAELRDRDGRTRSVRVPLPRPAEEEGESGQLRELRRGLVELQQRVVELLAPLVQEEREAAGDGGGGGQPGNDEDDEEEEEDDDDEGEGIMDAEAGASDPPAKRTRVQQL